MFPEFLVLFREFLEAAVIVGILLAYLELTKNRQYEKHIYSGVLAAIVCSAVVAYAFQNFLGGFDSSEELFEGIIMLIASALVSWLLIWMFEHRSMISGMRKNAQILIDKKDAMGIAALAFLVVFREGVEAVLFTYGIYVNTGSISMLGAILGVFAAAAVSLLIFKYAIKFNFIGFFKATMVFLVFLAAGLFSRSIHEFQEAKIIPTYIENVYNLNPPLNLDGSYPVMHEKGVVGSFLNGLVGYPVSPTEFQLLGYLSYLLAAFVIYKKMGTSKQ